MKKIKIGYFADGPWSHKAFQFIIKDPSIEICFIVPRSDSKDETLFQYAEKYKIPYFKGYNINSTDFYEKVLAYGCDLFVSMSFNQIFKQKITNLPRYGTINCHAGLLPFYRGRNILNWVLINDEKLFGITVHFIDEGIDTGDIILQKSFPITDNDTYATLLEIAHDECAKILYDAIKKIQINDFERVKQLKIHSTGFYCGQRKDGDEIINWIQDSREIFNFIRAICKPGPRATTTLQGIKLYINNSKLIKNAINYKGIEGQIVGKTKDGYVVKTKNSTIEILDIETTENLKIKIGDRLGT